jgi:hypothetical protein
MVAMYSSEMFVDFQRITWRYIPENSSLQPVACSITLNNAVYYSEWRLWK